MADSALPLLSRPWSLPDLADLPEDGSRYEIVEGSLLVSPPPTARHQLAVARLTRALTDTAPDHLRVLPGVGVAVTTPAPGTYLVPDVAVVKAPAATEEQTALLPDQVVLVAEVVSPSTVTRDTVTKRAIYARLGIPHYWLVDTAGVGRLTALRLRPTAGVYVEAGEVTGAEALRVEAPYPVAVSAAALLD